MRDICSVIEEMGNPFEESQDLVIFDSKDIAGPSAMETVINAKKIGHEHFEAFTGGVCWTEQRQWMTQYTS